MFNNLTLSEFKKLPDKSKEILAEIGITEASLRNTLEEQEKNFAKPLFKLGTKQEPKKKSNFKRILRDLCLNCFNYNDVYVEMVEKYTCCWKSEPCEPFPNHEAKDIVVIDVALCSFCTSNDYLSNLSKSELIYRLSQEYAVRSWKNLIWSKKEYEIIFKNICSLKREDINE